MSISSRCALALQQSLAFAAVLLLNSSSILLAADPVGLRIRFGIGDRQSLPWDGTIEVSEGKIEALDGWRFQQTDEVIDTKSWKAQTRRGAVRRTNNPARQAAQANANRNQAPVMDNGIVVAIDGTSPQTRVSVKTKQGDFDFSLSEVEVGKVKTALDNRVEIERNSIDDCDCHYENG